MKKSNKMSFKALNTAVKKPTGRGAGGHNELPPGQIGLMSKYYLLAADISQVSIFSPLK